MLLFHVPDESSGRSEDLGTALTPGVTGEGEPLQTAVHHFMLPPHVLRQPSPTGECALAAGHGALEAGPGLGQLGGAAGVLEAVVGHHLGPGLSQLAAGGEAAPVGTEHLGVDVLHVSAQGVPAEKSLATYDAVSDEKPVRVGPVNHRTGDVVEIRLLGFLECLGHRDETVQPLPLLTL